MAEQKELFVQDSSPSVPRIEFPADIQHEDGISDRVRGDANRIAEILNRFPDGAGQKRFWEVLLQTGQNLLDAGIVSGVSEYNTAHYGEIVGSRVEECAWQVAGEIFPGVDLSQMQNGQMPAEVTDTYDRAKGIFALTESKEGFNLAINLLTSQVRKRSANPNNK